MVYFESDYTTGAHPKLLERLVQTNLEPATGYGADPYSASAKEKIRLACGDPSADVWFLVGGTQTNAVAISTILRDWEGVAAADTGHISTHESGAIEYTGHKVLSLPHHNGKIDAGELDAFVQRFYGDANYEHMVFPGMVYITHPTEMGTLYSLKEMEALSAVCRQYEIPLYLDGARLGYGLASRETDVTLPDIARLCDAFYIGGTKVGALCGEALVFPRGGSPRHFLTQLKRRGALLAKGRLAGVQFDALFTDGLYFEIGRHAIDMAEALKAVLAEKHIPFAWNSPTNQQFVILEDSRLEALQQHVALSSWEKADANHTVVRLATSWSTLPEDISRLRELL